MTLRLAERTTLTQPSAVREILKVAESPDVLSFAGGLPAPELFPIDAIAKAHALVLAREGRQALQYSTTEGFLPLRQWIVRRMISLGIPAETDTTLITNGSQQGIDLAARVLLDPGSRVAVESPSYLAALQVFQGYGAKCVSIASDHDGMRIDDLERQHLKDPVRLVYLVPNFQNPKGTTLSLARRHALVKFAQKYEVPILEDDPYGALRFEGVHLPSLAALDDKGLVVHLGTFSKTLAPGLRNAWATGPREVIRAMTVAKQAVDLHTATLAQRATSALLETFDYEAHLDGLRKVYGSRRNVMLAALEKHMPEGTSWTRPEGGMFVWVSLPAGLVAEELFHPALAEKVAFVPGSSFFANDKRFDTLRLNFSNLPPELIESGLARLGKVIARAAAGKAFALRTGAIDEPRSSPSL